MSKKILAIIVLVLSVAVLVSGCLNQSTTNTATSTTAAEKAATQPAETTSATAQKKASRVFKIGATSNAKDAMAVAGQHFVDRCNELLGEEITFEYYTGEQLGNTSTMLENMQVGLQEGMTVALDALAEYSPDLGIMSMAFVFEDHAHLFKYLESEYGKKAFNKLEEAGFHVLNYDFRKNPRLIFAKKPIKVADDLNGVKFRVPDITIFERNFRTLGAVPTVVAWSEYTYALMQGVVDAGECTYENVVDNDFHKYAPYISLVDYAYPLESIVLSTKAWESLTAEQQKIVQQCADEASKLFNESIVKSWEEDKKIILEDGGQFVDFDKETFMKKIAPLAEELEKEGFFDTEGLYDYVQSLRDK